MDQITPEQIIAAYATRALVAESALRQAQAELDTLRAALAQQAEPTGQEEG